ncbi:MAG: hypothetical protein AB7L84_08025 [Acidimicrobiia bacterium]
MTRPALRGALVGIGLLTFAWALLGLGARATYGARTTADEPQYLLTALSLWEDRSLAIGDELDEQRWRDFHEALLPVQTQPVDDDGTVVSPHDPLLPVLLAVPVGLAGWAGAKAALAALAGVLAALLVWTAVRRFGVDRTTALVVVGAFSLTAPLTAYATQVYPELPAALAVTVALAALTGPLDRSGRLVLAGAVVALPWLGVKYAPVAAVLAVAALALLWRRGDRAATGWTVAGLAGAGLVFLVAHRVLYGGWTVYAAGDHFVTGELGVMGFEPDYLGRTRRLAGLLLDRDFGLAAWSPVFLAAVPALAALVRRRPAGWATLVGTLAAGWATATWVAFTMHGWWWPGRQTVVVVPCVVLTVAWWVDRLDARRARAVVAGLGALGALFWGWFVVEVLAGGRRLIIDVESTSDPLLRAWRSVLPDYRDGGVAPWLWQALWLAMLAGAAAWAWQGAGGGAPAGGGGRSARSGPGSGGDEDPAAGEGADADVPALDLHGGRPVG